MNSRKQIDKTAVRRIISSMIIIALSILIIMMIPIASVLKPKEIKNIWNPDNSIKENSYVYTTIDKLNYTGYKVNYFNSIQFGYYYALEGDKCFFVLVPVDAKPKQVLENTYVRGKYVSLTNNKSFDIMAENLANDLNWNMMALKSASGNYMIDSSRYQPEFIVIALVVLGVIIAVQLISILHCIIICKKNTNTIQI